MVDAQSKIRLRKGDLALLKPLSWALSRIEDLPREKINGGTLRESATALALSAPQRPQLILLLGDGQMLPYEFHWRKSYLLLRGEQR